MTNSRQKKWANIYQKFGENLPWCLEEVPGWFKQLVSAKWVEPCKTLDIGCGVGNYAGYLAGKGFEVTGIDLSEKAIEMARVKHSEAGLTLKVGDAFDLNALDQKFDFVYEVSLLHNIEPRKREAYVKELYSSLNDNGKLMVCAFSKDDWLFRGKKSLYFPDLDNTVYPLSEEEIRNTFEDYFNIEQIKKVYFGRKDKRRRERFLCLMDKKPGVKK